MADLEKASFYAPNPEECEELAPHMARLLVKVEDTLQLPKWVHNAVVSSDDFVSIGLVVVGYLDRVGVLTKIMPYFTNSAKPKVNINNANSSEQSNGSVQTPGPGPVPITSIPFGIGWQHLDTV